MEQTVSKNNIYSPDHISQGGRNLVELQQGHWHCFAPLIFRPFQSCPYDYLCRLYFPSNVSIAVKITFKAKTKQNKLRTSK